IPASHLPETLGCELDAECDLVRVDAGQQTSVECVYAAGCLTPHSQLAVVAAAEGAMAAIHIHKSLIPAERRVLKAGHGEGGGHRGGFNPALPARPPSSPLIFRGHHT